MGKLFGDRGYISSDLFKKLLKKGVKLITNVKLNMKNKLPKLVTKNVHYKAIISYFP